MVPFKSQEFRSASWFWNGETDLSRCGAVPSPSTVSDNILLNSEEKLKAVIESRKCWDGKRDVNRCGVMRYPLKAIVVVTTTTKRLALYKFIQHYTFLIELGSNNSS